MHSRPARSRQPRSQGLRRESKHAKCMNVRVSREYPWLLLGHLRSDLAQWLTDSEGDTLAKIIRSRDVTALLELKTRWGLQSINSDAESYSPGMAARLLLSAVVSKYPFEGREKEKVNAALQNVEAAEVSCSAFNRVGWRSLFIDGHEAPELLRMQEFVGRVVGLLVPDGTAITEGARHGPGSDTGTFRGQLSVYDKYRNWPYHVSPGAWFRARQLISNDERWLGALEDSYRRRFCIPMWELLDWEVFWDRVLTKVDTNRITTVPKDGVKNRPIAIEPRLNLMLQLGVADYFTARLKRWGVNLGSQEKNREMAYEGSLRKDGDSPCTIDLSNASDTVSLRLVKLLLPRPWFEYLCELRSPKGVLPCGRHIRYSKVSSMGNGYTFALESVCFSAIAYAVSMHVYGTWRPDLFAIYGDDLVVPSCAVHMMLTLLRCCGFTVNQAKSFVTGPVRESCGADWFRGVYVRPVYIDSFPTHVTELFAARNLLRRWALNTLGEVMQETENYLLGMIPEAVRLWGPVSDQEFSSYLHTEARGDYINSSFRFVCIVCRPRRHKGNDFLFRKLMHDLRPAKDEPPWMRKSWLKKLKAATGSRFVVTERDDVTYTLCSRQTPEWGAEYRSPVPRIVPEMGT